MIRELNVGLEPLRQGWLEKNWTELRGEDSPRTTSLFVDLGARTFLMLGIGRWSGYSMSVGGERGEPVAPYYPISTGGPHIETVETVFVSGADSTQEFDVDLAAVYRAFVSHTDAGTTPIDHALGRSRLDISGRRDARVDMHLVPESQVVTRVPFVAVDSVEEWASQFTPWSRDYDDEQLFMVSMRDMIESGADTVQMATAKPVFVGQV